MSMTAGGQSQRRAVMRPGRYQKRLDTKVMQIENPFSKERFTFLQTDAGTNGEKHAG